MRKSMTLSCVALALLVGHAERARACSCMEMDVPTAVERADAVFEGRVVEIVRGDPSTPARVTLEVVQQWKGVDHERVVVETAADSAECGVAFEEGTSWLVYAQRAGDVLRADLCSRTKRIEDAGEDRAQLGAGVVPVDIGEDDGVEAPAHEPPARGGCASCSIVARSTLPIPGALAMIAIVGVALRRRR